MIQELIQLTFYPLNHFNFCPSNDIFHKCIVVHFLWHRDVYDLYMSEIPVTTISLDHTFKVSSNVGYCREWVTLYNSVFVCMNEIGQWQFTSSTSIDEVHPLLVHIKSRLVQDATLQVFVDNCTVRSKMHAIFGDVKYSMPSKE